MPGLNKRELMSKPLRMDVRMARDAGKLASDTGYSQNDVFVMAIKEYLFVNRAYFMDELIEDKCISRIEREVRLMRGDSHFKFGDLRIDMTRIDDVDAVAAGGGEKPLGTRYKTILRVVNDKNETLYKDEREVDMFNGEWDKYKEFMYGVIEKYISPEAPSLETDFREKFAY